MKQLLLVLAVATLVVAGGCTKKPAMEEGAAMEATGAAMEETNNEAMAPTQEAPAEVVTGAMEATGAMEVTGAMEATGATN